MTRGRFITLEGGEGAGKSTHATLLRDALARRGIEVVLTREPGGAPNAERIRALLLAAGDGPWAPLTEALLHFAARREHLAFTILPSLERGAWVVCDRFTDSTRAYQGYGLGLSLEVIERLDAIVCEGRRPDLTVVLDLPPETGLARAKERDGGEGSRYERMDLAFHRRLRDGFREIARGAPERCVLIDAEAGIERVHEAIMSAIRQRLGLGDGG